MMKRAEHMAKRGWTKTKLSYRQIGKAYQASLNAFKEKLEASGVSALETAKQRKAALQNGKIPSAAAVITNYKARQAKEEAQREQSFEERMMEEANAGQRDDVQAEVERIKGSGYVPPDMGWKRDDMRAADAAATAQKTTKRAKYRRQNPKTSIFGLH